MLFHGISVISTFLGYPTDAPEPRCDTAGAFAEPAVASFLISVESPDETKDAFVTSIVRMSVYCAVR